MTTNWPELDKDHLIKICIDQNIELDALWAKLAAMESQEPVAYVESVDRLGYPDRLGYQDRINGVHADRKFSIGDHLYAKPVPADKPAYKQIRRTDLPSNANRDHMLNEAANRAEYFFRQIDGSYKFPAPDGQVYQIIEMLLAAANMPDDKPVVSVPDDVYEALANELWELGLDTKPGSAPQLGEVYEILDKHLAIAPSHSQQSARITSADQFIDGRYYWCKFTNRNAVSYGDTVIWQFTQSRRDAPYLAHHPVDAELFAKAEIYGPVPMPELSREHCPSHESEQGGAV